MSRVFAPVLLLFLAGCQTVGPEHRTPETPAPRRFDAASAAVSPDPVDARWWRTFGDPVLAGLVERALRSNLDLAEAEARIREARAVRRQAGAGAAPELDADAALAARRLSGNGAQLANLPPGVDPDLRFESLQAGFDARWELDLWGRTRRSVEAADARVGSAQETLHAARLSVAAEVARAYAEHRAAAARLEAARASARASAETARLVGLRVRSGEAADLELRRAFSQAREDAAVPPRLEAEARAALYAVDRLLDAPSGETARLLARTPQPALAAPPVVPVGLPSDLARRRPDVRRAERELAAATAEIGVATADLYPRFSLVGSLGLESIEPGNFADSASRFWSVGPALALPLLDGGRRRAEVRRREAARDAALAAYRGAVVGALAEVETALVRYERERARAERLAEAEADLRRAAQLTRLRYQGGEAALTEALDAERQAARVEDALAESRGRVLVNLVALYKALGGGWEA